MTALHHHLSREKVAVADSQLRLVEGAVREDDLLTFALQPYAIGVWRGRVGERDMMKRDLLARFHQTGGQQNIDPSVAHHAMVEIREPSV